MIADSYLQNCFSEIDTAVARAQAFCDSDPLLSAYLGGYLCIITTGVFEACVEFLVSKRAGQSNDKPLEAYVRATVSQTFRNPDAGQIRDILKKFDPKYKDQFNTRVSSDAVTALDSIVTIKNGLAHGVQDALPVNVPEAVQYIDRSRVVLEVFEDILRGPVRVSQ